MTDKPKRKFTDVQMATFRRNAAKARKKLALMRKQGLPIGKPKKEKEGVTEMPLAMIEKPMPTGRRFKKPQVDTEQQAVDALAKIIVATWAELQRRQG